MQKLNIVGVLCEKKKKFQINFRIVFQHDPIVLKSSRTILCTQYFIFKNLLALQYGAPFCADTKNIGLEIINTFGYLCSAWQEMAFMDLAGKPNVLFNHNVLARFKSQITGFNQWSPFRGYRVQHFLLSNNIQSTVFPAESLLLLYSHHLSHVASPLIGGSGKAEDGKVDILHTRMERFQLFVIFENGHIAANQVLFL